MRRGADRDAALVAERNGDLLGGRTSARAVAASVAFNRTMRRLLEDARRQLEARQRGDHENA